MKPKKHLGQNFLINKNVIKKITESVNTKDKIVLEIGPGKGALSSTLIKNSHELIAFEIDESLKEYLTPLEESHQNFTVIYNDILKIDLNEFLKQRKISEVYLIANIPYYITGLLLNKIKETKNISTAIIMMQKEVGERLLANVGSKAYGALSVVFNTYFDISKVINVSKTSFYPKPKVDSVVLKFIRTDKYLKEIKNITNFNEFVEAAFKMKRKTLINNLVSYYNLSKEETIKNLTKIDAEINVLERAENITLKRFINFANGWYKWLLKPMQKLI